MTNLRTFILRAILRLVRTRKMNPAAMRAPYRSDTVARMQKPLSRFDSRTVDFDGHRMVTFSRPGTETRKHILYLHGGAYVWQGVYIHWNFIGRLLEAVDCRISYLDYPLAPESSYRDTFRVLCDAFDDLVENFPEDRFVFMGDSAGGGLALAFAQQLVKENFTPQPEMLVLLSPWLDLTMENPKIKFVEPRDPVLSVRGLLAAAEMYAGGVPLDDPLLSPVNGAVSGLGKILLFTGTNDILWPDCREFKERVLSAGGKLTYYEILDMPHTWMFLPIPEAEEALDDIVRALKNLDI